MYHHHDLELFYLDTIYHDLDSLLLLCLSLEILLIVYCLNCYDQQVRHDWILLLIESYSLVLASHSRHRHNLYHMYHHHDLELFYLDTIYHDLDSLLLLCLSLEILLMVYCCLFFDRYYNLDFDRFVFVCLLLAH